MKRYILFVDESGVADLRHRGQYFILATVLIDKDDFEIIEGYLRLLKRKFIGKDLVNIHTTDLCERPYMKYRKLKKPKDKVNSFLTELCTVLRNIPYQVGIYYVDKNKLRHTLNYVPTTGANHTLPYEKCALQAFFDFATFLNKKKAYGEIVVESRFGKDGDFVKYFDTARTTTVNRQQNPLAPIVKERINSLEISNKRIVSGGLELADICAYATLRKFEGDPQNRVKVSMTNINNLLGVMKKNSYLSHPNQHKVIEIQ